jgi:hypothetical protein
MCSYSRVLSLSLSRLWQHVSAALRKNDQETATTEKCKIEDAQREAVRRREEEKVRSQPSIIYLSIYPFLEQGKVIPRPPGCAVG